LSEYTFDGPISERVKAWCRQHKKYLMAGERRHCRHGILQYGICGRSGRRDCFPPGQKRPIQFFKDGRPAREQKLWESPWGKLGICVCYDLSYRRITDELIRQGAQAIIAPTMDVADWGGISIAFTRAWRPCGRRNMACRSSGLQFRHFTIDRRRRLRVASAPFPGEHATIAGRLNWRSAAACRSITGSRRFRSSSLRCSFFGFSGKALLSKFSEL